MLVLKIAKVRKSLKPTTSMIEKLHQMALGVLRELYACCHAKVEGDYYDTTLDSTRLCTRMRELHDDLLKLFRPLFAESVIKPKNGIRLTNVFIHFGSEYFIGPLLNDDTPVISSAREDIVHSLRAFMNSRGLSIDEGKSSEASSVLIIQGQRYNDAHSADKAMQKKLNARTFAAFVRDSRARIAFKSHIKDQPDTLLLFSCWRAIENYKLVTRPVVRRSRASTLISKFLSPIRDSTQSIRGCFDNPADTAAIALAWKTARSEDAPQVTLFDKVELVVESALDIAFEDFMQSSAYEKWRESVESQLETIKPVNLNQVSKAEPKSCSALDEKQLYEKYAETPREVSSAYRSQNYAETKNSKK